MEKEKPVDDSGIPLLTFEEYIDCTDQTAIYPEAGSGSVNALMYATLGFVGEAGEVANQVKKILRDDNGELSELRRGRISKELGDACWYLARILKEAGLDSGSVFAANIDKLLERKGAGTIQGDGEVREASLPAHHSVTIKDDGTWVVNHVRCAFESAPAACDYHIAAIAARLASSVFAMVGTWDVELDRDGSLAFLGNGNGALCGEDEELVMSAFSPVPSAAEPPIGLPLENEAFLGRMEDYRLTFIPKNGPFAGEQITRVFRADGEVPARTACRIAFGEGTTILEVENA